MLTKDNAYNLYTIPNSLDPYDKKKKSTLMCVGNLKWVQEGTGYLPEYEQKDEMVIRLKIRRESELKKIKRVSEINQTPTRLLSLYV